jgi:hypothetical protein
MPDRYPPIKSSALLQLKQSYATTLVLVCLRTVVTNPTLRRRLMTITLMDAPDETIHRSDPLGISDLRKIDSETRRALENYKRAIESLASKKSDFIFPNSTGFHAAIVLSTMVRHSLTRFRLYDESLNGDISGLYDTNRTLINSIRSHVSEGRSLEIVVRQNSFQDSRIFKILAELCAEFSTLVSVRVASPKFKMMVQKTFEKDLNFAVGDDCSFRLEEHVGDAFERKAICSFCQPNYAKLLNKIFDKEFSTCESVF